jgi:hypothetical protein
VVHRLSLAGERFVPLIAEDLAEVGDGGGHFRGPRCGHGTEAVSGDGGRWLKASEAIEKGGEDSQRATDSGGVA